MHIGLLGTVRTVNPVVRPELHPALPAGTQLSAWPSRVGVFPSTPVEKAMQALGHLDAGLNAAAAGADAVVIDSIADYGLDALEAGLSIPVVGSGKAGMAAAARHGRFALVTVWPRSMNFAPETLLKLYGHENGCVGIYNVAEEGILGAVSGADGYLSKVNSADRGILDKVLAGIEAAVDAGADAIMLGCTCMSPMAAAVTAAVRVPVINPLAEGVKAALAFGARDGASAPITTERADLVHRMVDAIAGEADENCPVCVVAEAF